jgi:ABC-type transporter lipoprotein component MlaA
VLDVYNRDYYDIESKIKRYVIKHVGTAYVACKEDTTTIQHGSFHKHIHDSHDK